MIYGVVIQVWRRGAADGGRGTTGAPWPDGIQTQHHLEHGGEGAAGVHTIQRRRTLPQPEQRDQGRPAGTARLLEVRQVPAIMVAVRRGDRYLWRVSPLQGGIHGRCCSASTRNKYLTSSAANSSSVAPLTGTSSPSWGGRISSVVTQ